MESVGDARSGLLTIFLLVPAGTRLIPEIPATDEDLTGSGDGFSFTANVTADGTTAIPSGLGSIVSCAAAFAVGGVAAIEVVELIGARVDAH